MGGYANRTIRLDFEELGTRGDPVWVVLKNPAMLPPAEIRPSNWGEIRAATRRAGDGTETADDDEGPPEDRPAAKGARELYGRLVVAWRVYDATTTAEYDPTTGEEIPGTGQTLLPPPTGGSGVAPDVFARLPMEIQNRIGTAFSEALDPRTPGSGSTPNGSSGQQSPPTTEPGSPAPSQAK